MLTHEERAKTFLRATRKICGTFVEGFLSFLRKTKTQSKSLQSPFKKEYGELMSGIGPCTGVTWSYGRLDNNFLVTQGAILAERVKRAGVVLTGPDLTSYEACLSGDCHSGDIYRLRELLARIGR